MQPSHAALIVMLLAAGPWREADAAGKPVLAVFDVELKGVPGGARLSASLTSYLASRLGETGRFAVVPRARLQRALAAKRRESYRSCYAQSCQIEIGQEVAAHVAVTTQVHRIGPSCVVMSNLYDLRTATSGIAGTARGGCAEAALLRLLDAVVNKVARDGSAAPDPEGPRRAQVAELLVLGSPDAARVVVSAPRRGRRECTLPCHLRPVSPATYTLEVSAPGFVTQRRAIAVSAGRAVGLSVDLKPGATASQPTDEPPASAPSPATPSLWQTLHVSPLTRATRERHQVPPQVNFGVVVNRVAAGSRIARHGVLVGDVILEVNGRKIETPAHLRRALDRVGRRFEILLHRAGRSLLIKL